MDIAKTLAFGRAMNAVAAGTTTQNGTAVDLAGADGVVFIASFGTLTATTVTKLKAQQGAASDGSDGADLAGTSQTIPDTDSNKLLVLDVPRPQKRYVRPVITRATANAVIDGISWFTYKLMKEPTTDDSTVSGKKIVVSPAEGTP